MASIISEVSSSLRSSDGNCASNRRPLPLKQRTSSVDTRRDYSYFQTWWSLRDLIKLRECFIVVNNYPIWRRHLAWAMENGGDLRNYMTQRYASSMVFLSLMLAAELNVLFNSSPVTTGIRLSLHDQSHFTLKFWVGVTILVSIILTLLSLVVTFTAWGMVSAISDENAHCILRSSIGQYVGELPQRFTVASIYSFLIWIMMFIFVLIPVGFWSILLLLIVLFLLFHTITVFSAFGRLILHTTAMSPNRIFEEGYEKGLTPQPLQEQLHTKAMAELSNGTSITRQYRRKMKPLDRKYEQDELAAVMRRSGNYPVTPDSAQEEVQYQLPPGMHTRSRAQSTGDGGPASAMRDTTGPRKRADSSVRFADQFLSPAPAVKREDSRAAAMLTPTVEERSRLSSRDSPATIDTSNSFMKETSNSGSSLKDMVMPLTDSLPPVIPPPPADSTPRGISVSSLDDWLSGSTPTPTPGMGDASCRKQITGTVTAADPFAALPMPLPPQEVSTKRNVSIISSFDDFDRFPYNERALTNDEKFDLDYGEGTYIELTNDAIAGSKFEEAKPNNETRGLLSNSNRGSGGGNNYSSTESDMV
jgi:hypothetical protein